MKREEVRLVDEIAIRDFGMTGLVLMENAGRGAAQLLERWSSRDQPMKILCGRGNNGGDGYVIARHLQLAGFEVQIVSVVPLDRLTDDAAANARIALAAEIPLRVVGNANELKTAIDAYDQLIDCLLGTGARGAPRGIYRDAILLANSLRGPRVAIDVPSGLDCDTGIANEPTFRANATITFVAEKDGFANPQAEAFVGQISVVPIGVPRKLLEQFGL
ncbi:MAG: NAD(P)H-hydrate epimerase [Planctomycetota bacterium]